MTKFQNSTILRYQLTLIIVGGKSSLQKDTAIKSRLKWVSVTMINESMTVYFISLFYLIYFLIFNICNFNRFFNFILYYFSGYWRSCRGSFVCHSGGDVHCLSHEKKGWGFLCSGWTQTITCYEFLCEKCHKSRILCLRKWTAFLSKTHFLIIQNNYMGLMQQQNHEQQIK